MPPGYQARLDLLAVGTHYWRAVKTYFARAAPWNRLDGSCESLLNVSNPLCTTQPHRRARH